MPDLLMGLAHLDTPKQMPAIYCLADTHRSMIHDLLQTYTCLLKHSNCIFLSICTNFGKILSIYPMKTCSSQLNDYVIFWCMLPEQMPKAPQTHSMPFDYPFLRGISIFWYNNKFWTTFTISVVAKQMTTTIKLVISPFHCGKVWSFIGESVNKFRWETICNDLSKTQRKRQNTVKITQNYQRCSKLNVHY